MSENTEEVLDGREVPEYRGSQAEEADHTQDADESSVEEQARALGWVPEEDYSGRNWVGAEAFVEAHAKHNGVLRKALANQAKDLEALKAQIRGLDAAHKKVFELQMKKQKEEFDQQISFLKAQKREALRSGEHEAAADIDEQLDTLRTKGPELPEVPKETRPEPGAWRQNKTMADWAERNPWFDVDEDMSAYAGAIGQKIRHDNPELAFDRLLDEVTVRVKKAFPTKFTGARKSSPVEAATTGGSRSVSPRSYDSLPKEARVACDDAVEDGGITRKQWVDLYFGYEDRRGRR